MTRFLATALLGILTILLVLVYYRAAVDVSRNLSPQGCRMSWMSPSYVLQSNLDSSWSPLASRYSLWLYRELGWESDEVRGVPVLFIPGNAGSSRQVRSIASSAARQFYSEPYTVSPDFASRSLKPLDFFSVEFNEDLSALHGPTIDSQVSYSASAISYILSQYPPGTKIIVIGHSMGGIVATSLLPSKNISTIITMSTPHVLPPARFDSRIDRIYGVNYRTLLADPTPIISLCGGAADMMITSESCILPMLEPNVEVYRRTVFTSALEGAWTGVGHREMVWCHQVRWRVAKAALELGEAHSVAERGRVLDTWLRDGQVPSPILKTTTEAFSLADPKSYETIPAGDRLVLKQPRGPSTHLLPIIQSSSPAKFLLFVSQGSIPPISPYRPLPLRISVHFCDSVSVGRNTHPRCVALDAETLKLIPNPVAGKVYPTPDEGVDESEGVVLFEAEIPPAQVSENRWLAVVVENADGRGWVVGGLESSEEMRLDAGTLTPFFGKVSLTLPSRHAFRTSVSLPNFLSNALLVYRLSLERKSTGNCTDPLLSPLVSYTSHIPEGHYYPLIHSSSRSILLHSHGSAPYIPTLRPLPIYGLNFIVYSSDSSECDSDISTLEISVDWWSTIGRCATRYPTTLACWSVGVVALLVFGAWERSDQGAPVPSVQKSLTIFSVRTLPKLLVLSVVASFVPLPENFYLGNKGQPVFAPLAPLLLLNATGLVCVSWWALQVLIWPIGKFGAMVFERSREDVNARKTAFVSMCLVFLFIFLFIPWQVAYLGSWLIHLHTCASSTPRETFPGSQPSLSPTPVETPTATDNHDRDDDHDKKLESRPKEWEKSIQSQYCRANNYHHNMHLLLLMTWLLPLAAPVLAVWVRTLTTAGFTTPFSGDHFFPNVAPFLIFADFASWTTEPLFEKHRFERVLSVRWSLIVLAGSAFLIGPRKPYFIFDVAKIAVGLMVLLRIGSRCWGGRCARRD